MALDSTENSEEQKGFAHRELALAWGVLTHNLWMLARLRKGYKRSDALPKAA